MRCQREPEKNIFLALKSAPRKYGSIVSEIIQLLGTSSLLAAPAEADFDTPLAQEIDQYLSTDTTNTRDRAQLFHLAWDVACSAFSGRQVLYERMFGGNAVRNASILFNNYDKEPFRKRVRELLESDN